MIIFDIRIGHFSVLAQREPVSRIFKITREVPGEVIIDLPFASVIFTNEHRASRTMASSLPE